MVCCSSAADRRPGIPGKSSARRRTGLLERLGALDLAPFRFHGWLGNRRTQSFGWRYDFDDASFTPPSRSLLAASVARPRPRLSPPSPTTSSTCWSPVTIPAPASAGTATATCSSRSSESRSERRDAAFRRRMRDRVQARQPRSRAPLGLSAVRQARYDGSTASCPATGCASRSPSEAVRKGPARRRATARKARNGTVLPACGAAAVAARARRLLEGPGSRLAIHRQARSLAAEWAMVNEQAAQGKLTATYVESDAPSGPPAAASDRDVTDPAKLRLRRRDLRRCFAPRRCGAAQLRAHADTSSRSRTPQSA